MKKGNLLNISVFRGHNDLNRTFMPPTSGQPNTTTTTRITTANTEAASAFMCATQRLTVTSILECLYSLLRKTETEAIANAPVISDTDGGEG